MVPTKFVNSPGIFFAHSNFFAQQVTTQTWAAQNIAFWDAVTNPAYILVANCTLEAFGMAVSGDPNVNNIAFAYGGPTLAGVAGVFEIVDSFLHARGNAFVDNVAFWNDVDGLGAFSIRSSRVVAHAEQHRAANVRFMTALRSTLAATSIDVSSGSELTATVGLTMLGANFRFDSTVADVDAVNVSNSVLSVSAIGGLRMSNIAFDATGAGSVTNVRRFAFHGAVLSTVSRFAAVNVDFASAPSGMESLIIADGSAFTASILPSSTIAANVRFTSALSLRLPLLAVLGSTLTADARDTVSATGAKQASNIHFATAAVTEVELQLHNATLSAFGAQATANVQVLGDLSDGAAWWRVVG